MKVGFPQWRSSSDSIAPVVGWKVWSVEHAAEQTRLHSVLYGDAWIPGHAAEAQCPRPLRVRHTAPFRTCECGIHAAKELGAWSHYLTVGEGRRVFGRVALWGALIEGEHGWRGEFAYPLALYVPARVPNAAAVALGLTDYGVPVELTTAVEAEELVAA